MERIPSSLGLYQWTPPRSAVAAQRVCAGCPFSRAFYALGAGEAISRRGRFATLDCAGSGFVLDGSPPGRGAFLWLDQLVWLRVRWIGQGLTEARAADAMGRDWVAGWPGWIPRARSGERIQPEPAPLTGPRLMSGRPLGHPHA